MRFENPYLFHLLWLVILICMALYALYRYRRLKMKRFIDKQLIDEMAASFSDQRYKFKIILLGAVFFFSVLALVRPQFGFQWQEVKRRGLDIFVAIDTSKSMLTQDVKPNRLERTKLAVKDLIRQLRGDRIGLVAFAGESFLVCPLTVDYSGFLLSLNDLNTNTIPRGGTQLGAAIKEVLKGYEKQEAKYKAVILVTDGENLEGEPLEWANEAREKGIKIYTVGIGTKEGELIRITNAQGEKEFLKDNQGNFVKSRLNEGLLQQMASITGGAYVRASGAQFGLDYIYQEQLAKLERRDIESKMEKRYNEHFQWPLAIAIFALVMETVISTRKQEDE